MSNFVVNIYSFVLNVILADSSSGSTVDRSSCSSIPVPFQEICQNYPFVESIFWLFTALAMIATALVAFTGNLQTIIDFFKSNLLRQPVEVSESQSNRLSKQLLVRLQSDIAIRRENSLHNLIKIDLE